MPGARDASAPGEAPGAPVFQWAQQYGEVGGVHTSQQQLTRQLRSAGHRVRYVDTGSVLRAVRALPGPFLRRGLHLFHITRLWRAIVMAPVFAILRGRTVLVLHSGSTANQLEAMRPTLRRLLHAALHGYDEIWAVNEGIVAVLPPGLRRRTSVVTPFDASALPPPDAQPREPHAMALATNAGLGHYNADLGIDVARIVRTEWPDLTLTILAYGNDGPELAVLRRLVAQEPWVTMPFNLPTAEVAAVLRRIGTFLRPTSWDGDSVIVREALASGARVVASDVAPRPRGVEVARLDARPLAEAVLRGGVVSDGSGVTDAPMIRAAETALARLAGAALAPR